MEAQYNQDYEPFRRDQKVSIKYMLGYNSLPEIDKQSAIVVSYADMEFKFPKRLLEKLKTSLQVPHFGYCVATNNQWSAVRNWVSDRYCNSITVDKTTTIFWNNLVSVISASIHAFSEPNDEILCFVPTYYKFINDIESWKRKCIRFQFDLSDKVLKIDFEKLEKTLKTHNIKLLILSNPGNPCGTIWSHDTLSKLKDLLIKYKINVYSDEIFAHSVQPHSKFTSMICFEQLAPYLVCSYSHSKAMNCSGMSCAYTLTRNEKINENLFKFQTSWGLRPSVMGYKLMQLSLTDPSFINWSKTTDEYIQQNFLVFKKLCSEKLEKLKIFDLESSFLSLVDFAKYKNLNFKSFIKYFAKVNIIPTIMTHITAQSAPVSLIRFNIACNRQIIVQLVDRLSKMVQLPWIE